MSFVKNFDFTLLKLFLEENLDFLLGARIQKIQQPTRQELIFSMRNKGESKKLYVNINPRFFHVCFLGTEGEKRRMLEIPKQPPMFCMLLRKYLESAKIAKVVQPERERILEFYFETHNELSEKIYLCLAIELMGKHSNVVLYNYDTNVIIGCAHNVGSDKSRERELIGGLPYAYPSKRNNHNFCGLSAQFNGKGSVNDFIDNHFAQLQEEDKIKKIKSRLLSFAKAKIRRADTALEKIKKQASDVNKADSYRKKGDLILANLSANADKEFSKSIEVFDWETNSNLKIELDKTKTLKENANQYYKLYNKAKTTSIKTEEMTRQLMIDKEYFEQVLYSIESAESVDELLEIQDEINYKWQIANGKGEEGTGNRRQRKENHSAIQPFNLSAQKQFTVFVGKNNKQNDYIVSKIARDEDLWFHVHNCAGSHVLLRIEAGQNVTDEIIFECAKLAKEHSSAKNSSKVGVIYTKRKFLKKPTGANLGYVTYKNEQEIIVD